MKKWFICSVILLLVLTGCQREEVTAPEEGREVTINYYFAISNEDYPQFIEDFAAVRELKFYIDSIERIDVTNINNVRELPTLTVNSEVTIDQFYTESDTINSEPAFTITYNGYLNLKIWLRGERVSFDLFKAGYAVDTLGDTLDLYFGITEDYIESFFSNLLNMENAGIPVSYVKYYPDSCIVIKLKEDHLIPLAKSSSL